MPMMQFETIDRKVISVPVAFTKQCYYFQSIIALDDVTVGERLKCLVTEWNGETHMIETSPVVSFKEYNRGVEFLETKYSLYITGYEGK